MDILFEDSEIIVAVKPWGVLSQSDSHGQESMTERLSAQTGSAVFPVHRLDRTTMGGMVFAKTAASAAALSDAIARKTFLKTYLALVHGTVTPPAGEMRDLLYFDRTKNKSFIVAKERRGVKTAILQYHAAPFSDGVTRLDIRLETGRTHQIRVQCASRGFPLLGDHRYGAHDPYSKIALFARKLTFPHPVSGREMTFDLTDTPYSKIFFEPFETTIK